MALGQTHWRWRPDVRQLVTEVLRRWPNVSANTYVDHPWPGWDSRSVDFWGANGRGWPINVTDGYEIRAWLMSRPGVPWIRHTIYLHRLWTSFGGASYWHPNDHSGHLRHLHVTYW